MLNRSDPGYESYISFGVTALLVVIPVLFFLPRRNAFWIFFWVAYLTPRTRAPTTAQSFTVVTVVDYMSGPAVLQALPPYVHTGVKLLALFNPTFDDVLFAVVSFHDLFAVCFTVDNSFTAAVLC